jgi:predicted nucleic acid-binding protein
VRRDDLQALIAAIEAGDLILTTGAIPLIVPDLRDHIEAAALRNRCLRAGIQAGTIDTLLAQLCLRHGLMMLSADTISATSRGNAP